MNRGVYRLIFNHERNAFVAVAEHVRGRGKRTARRRTSAALLGLVALAGQAVAAPPAANALPVPSSGNRPFVFAGTVNGGQPTVVGNAMTIDTASRTLGLNWQSFNIGSSASVTFNQPDAGSRVLNRIWSNDPSQIMGKLSANGQIYLINQNGILFGNGAQVNVGGLVASAVNLSDSMANQLLNRGLPTSKGERLEFAWDGSLAGFEAGFVTVEAGARISTPSGGKVVLIAPKTVENLGLIESGGGGEAILAAGGKVILTAPDDPALRGLLVETAAFSGKDALGNTVAVDGSVTNKGDGTANNGRIDMGQGGVVSLAALAVNQKGVVNATRAVNLNGTTMLVSGTTETDRLTINQRGDVAQIDWVSGFNVGAGKTVEFVQSSAGAVAYNFVYDPDRTAADGTVLNLAGRSSIDGILKASGQFVLVNERGIHFGSQARVSASNFVASALGLNPDIVLSGLLGQTDIGKRAFYLNKTAPTYNETDGSSAQVFAQALAAYRAATVDVQAGASIATTGSGGYVILAGSQVEQAGSIATPGGQTLLAAGADLYLKPGYASSARGFTAEVNPLYAVRTHKFDAQGAVVEDTNRTWLALSRGADVNAVVNRGSIAAAYGDITLVGHDVTQAGLLWASTSTSANGSIHLLARDQLNTQGEGEPTVSNVFWRQYGDQGMLASTGNSVSATADNVSQFVSGLLGGKLTFAAGSQTVVAIDASTSKTLTADQTFVKSSIEGVGKQVVVEDADIVAKGGNIRLRGSENFGEFNAFAIDAATPVRTASAPAGVGVFVSDGARLDVSGENVSKSVADLFIAVELRGDEFAGNPLQRDGALRGQTAYVDIRDKIAIADLSGWINKVGLTAQERAASGGTISLASTGSVIVKEGATLDVSGGKVDYATATVKESYALSANGQRDRLNDAASAGRYSSLTTVERQEAAYVEGKSAGTVEVVGHSLAVDGQLLARTTVGTRQRELGDPAGNRFAIPLGGQLIIKDAGQHFVLADRDQATEADKLATFSAAQMAFVNGAAKSANGLVAGDSAGPRLELSQSLVGNGFSRFDLTSDGRIDLPAGVALNLGAGGSFKASGRQIDVGGAISAPGGSIALTTRDMSAAGSDFPQADEARFSTLVLESGASLSTAGSWVNDFRDGALSNRAKAIDGGSISLTSAYDLDLRRGSSVDVSGSGRVKSDGSLVAGNAGTISLETGGVSSAAFEATGVSDRRDASLFLDGTLSGYALGTGGTLSIKTSQITLGQSFAQDSRDWSRARRLAAGQVGAAFDAGIVDRGGFFNFSFVGRDGLQVADGTQLRPDPVSWVLQNAVAYRNRPSGSALAGFAQARVLHSDLRSAPTSIALATSSPLFGELRVGEGAYVGVSPRGSIKLEAAGQMTVLGTLEAPAGSIALSRPVKDAYTTEKQSESIYLGEHSKLLATGSTVLTAATRQALETGASPALLLAQQRYRGEVLNGGTVSLDAGLGYLVTRSGSLIDVSGTTATLSTATSTGRSVVYLPRSVGSAGGTVSLSARDGMFLDGDFKATGGAGALAGVFALRFADTANADNPWDIQIPASGDLTAEQKAVLADRQLTLYQSAGSHAETWPAGVDTGQYLAGNATLDPLTHNGKARLDLAKLVAGGFGSWYLTSQHEMRFAGPITATVNNQLQLNAPRFAAAGNDTALAFTAAAIRLGNPRVDAGAPAAAADLGLATARFNGLDIGLIGTFSWNGFATTTLSSQGEMHFDSVTNNVANHVGGRKFNGQMTASGTLNLAAARLSPATYSDYRVDLLADPNGHINISRPAGSWADDSLSPAGRLEFAAANIVHDGTVTAPLGEIVFNAPGGKVTLGAGSVTSVASDYDLLFGYTAESGSSWNYLGNKVEALPGKSIRIDAADTVVASGAKLDLSGNGDARAWEFTAGPGGKTDVLSGSANTFAIVPGWQGQSITDADLMQAYQNAASGIAGLKVGDRITLAGESGSFFLLPARYAVLPGAYLVTVKSTDNSLLSGRRQQADGSWLVAGNRLALNADGSTTAYSATPLSFEVAAYATVAGRASYTLASASQFFYDQAGANLAGDAGRLTAIGRNSLIFDPTIIASRQASIVSADGRTRAGQGLEVDLAAPKILVSDNAVAADGSWSRLDQDKLNALGVSSLLIGGARTTEGGNTRIETIASEVVVNNSGKALSAEELMLVASDELKVAAGSRIETLGKAGARSILLTGDGAFLRAAEGPQAVLSRQGSVGRVTGKLDLQAGATVAGQSLIFDATQSNLLNGNIVLGIRQADGSRRAGGSLAIGAGRINIVANGTTPSDGLTLDNNDLLRFASADQLRLTSYSTLDLFGNATLGSASLKQLVIAAAGIAGHGTSQEQASIAAQTVSFENPNPDSAVFTTGDALGGGGLRVAANTIEFGDNASSTMRTTETTGFTIGGFDRVDLVASGDLRFVGRGVTRVDNSGGSGQPTALNIDAGRVTTVGTADHLLTASGATRITGGSAIADDSGLGGKLALRAQSLDIAGRIEVAAGQLGLAATGSSGNVTIRDGARISTEGKAVAYDDTYAYAPGGNIVMQSANGNIAVEQGAIVSVSAASGGGDAGALSLQARQGSVTTAAGTLRGTAVAGSEQASLKVDANQVALDELAGAVADAGGKQHFTGSWDVRQRSGDLVLNQQIKAGQVTLAADNGGIDIAAAGVIDASGSKGGTIGLYGRNGDVTLNGQLLARGQEVVSQAANAGTRGQGGTVTLATSGTGKVITRNGSLIDVGVAAGSLAQGGKVNLRAAEYRPVASAAAPVPGSLTIQVGGSIVGASDVGAEFVSSYNGTSLTAGTTSGNAIGLTTLKNNLGNLYSTANMASLRNALGFTNTALYHVRAGVDIATPANSTSDFTVAADLDFSTLRFAGEAGVLSIRAGRDLKINGTLSDGFSANGSNTAVSRDAKLNSSGQSWSYRLVAGADSSAAAPLAYVDAPAVGATTASDPLAMKGSIEIAANKLVRSGTGNIDLAARRDIKLNDRAAVYTAGTAATVQPAGFTPISGGTAQNSINSIFPGGGGDLSLSAGERVLMVSSGEAAPTARHINQWLFRAGGSNANLQWWPRIASFQQGVAAFGGGDVAVNAGKEIKNLTVVIPTNGRVPAANGENQPESALIQGGGDLALNTAGSVTGGLYYVETGKLLVKANEVKGNTGIALGNTAVHVVANGDVALGNVFNPMWGVGNKYVYNTASGTATGWAGNSGSEYTVRIGTYGDASALDVVSVAGNVELNAKDDFYGISDGETHRLMPARVKVAALNGDISGSVAQAPGTDGQLDLLASGSINLTENSVTQLDIPVELLPSVRNPLKNSGRNGQGNFQLLSLADSKVMLDKHSTVGWHAADYEASRMIALHGDITGQKSLTSVAEFNEAVHVKAGGDIVNLNLSAQHAHASDVTRLEAGGDVRYDTYATSSISGKTTVIAAPLGVQVAGPGGVEILAGGDIDLADTWGVVSRGNLDNASLPNGGASILMVAGAKPDYAALRAYLGLGSQVSDAELRQTFFNLMRDYGRAAIGSGSSSEIAWLDAAHAGDAAYPQGDGKAASYAKARLLSQALFPVASVGTGDIKLAVSQVKTEQGGDIQMLTPGGSVVAGVADPTLTKKSASQGIFTVNGGAVQAFVRDNFLVNQSRVFTLNGGDILIWADRGDIDAGSGAKTVIATPPPVLLIKDGKYVLDTGNAVSGSGIGVLASRDDTPASDMDLYAPNGKIDAGDAGVRITGKFRGGAQLFLNSNNIQAGGGMSGVPAAPVAAPAVASMTAPVNNENKALEEAAPAAGKRDGGNGMLTVEVLDSEPAAPSDKENERKGSKRSAG